MEFNWNLDVLVNAAGSFLFLVAGIFILVLARGARRGLLVGAWATAFGAAYIVQNLVLPNGEASASLLYIFTMGPAAVFEILLAIHLMQGLRRSHWVWFWSLCGTVFVMTAGLLLLAFLRPDLAPGIGQGGSLEAAAGFALQAQQLALVAPLAAIAVRFQEKLSKPGPEASALACLALALGPFTLFVFNAPPSVGVGARYLDLGPTSTPLAVLYQITCFVALVAAFPFVPRRPHPSLLQRSVFPVLLLAAFGGLALRIATAPTYDSEYGLYGVIRTLSVCLLVLGVLRYDLLGARVRTIVTRQGVLAGVALASLFIVAQIAQNFLSAEYGLLTGGVIAGAVLFAASPIQKAIEQRGPRPAATSARGEESYRKALRMAVRDRKLTRDEETALHELAHDLGISGPQAHALLVEAENEAGQKGRSR